MAIIKSYTDLEQSKVLAEILPLESADMMYQEYETVIGDDYGYNYRIQPFFNSNIDGIPCWSLAALLGVLPQSITKYIESARCQKTFHLNLFRSYYCCVSYDEMPSINDDNSLYCIGRDNWIDACYEMIIRLKE